MWVHARVVPPVALSLCVVLALAACGRGSVPKDMPLTTPNPNRLVSDPGCPPATTITSGTGPGQVPYCILTGEHDAGTGSQVAALRREFNREVLRLALDYCDKGGCVPVIARSDSVRGVLASRVAGWTELTIQPTGGGPKQVPPNVRYNAAYIVALSPNVACRDIGFKTESLKINIRTKTDTPHTQTPSENPPPPNVECQQPNPPITIKKGKLAHKTWVIQPSESELSLPGFMQFADTTGPAAADSVLDAALERARAKCSAGCEPYFDPAPQVKRTAGYVNTSGFGSATLFYAVEFTLENDVQIKCRRSH